MVLIPLPFDLLVSGTISGITGVRALIDHAYNSIPEMQSRALEALESQAKREDWNQDDYQAEKDMLRTIYEYWVPKNTAYSSITLLFSILETRLFACCERIRKEKMSPFGVRDLKYPALEATNRFIRNLTGTDVTKDPAWQNLRDMQAVRNIIVHRGGVRGEIRDHQDEFDSLLNRHRDNLDARTGLWFDKELWVSKQFYDNCVSEMEAFFRRLFKNLGLSE